MNKRGMESFSAKAKDELLRLETRQEHCRQAELCAMIQAAGSLILTHHGLFLELNSDHPALIRRMFGYLKELTGQSAQVLVRKNNRLYQKNNYALRLAGRETVFSLLTSLGVWENEQNIETMPATIRRTCCKRAYVRVLFLCGGSVINPEKAYHLEWTLKSQTLAQSLLALLQGWGWPARLTLRKGQPVVYIKDGDAVAGALAAMGASHAILEMENARIIRQMRNKANRAMNCDTANINKTMAAAAKQLACIRFLQAKGAFETLPAPLAAVAELRLSHPEATLEELAEHADPPMGKSGINHRLRKLVQRAEESGFVFEEGGLL